MRQAALRHAWLLAGMTAKRYLLVIFDPGSPLHFRVIAGPFDIAQPPIGFMGIERVSSLSIYARTSANKAFAGTAYSGSMTIRMRRFGSCPVAVTSPSSSVWLKPSGSNTRNPPASIDWCAGSDDDVVGVWAAVVTAGVVTPGVCGNANGACKCFLLLVTAAS